MIVCARYLHSDNGSRRESRPSVSSLSRILSVWGASWFFEGGAEKNSPRSGVILEPGHFGHAGKIKKIIQLGFGAGGHLFFK